MSDLNSRGVRQKYGTHGDLKPENILWFKPGSNSEGPQDLGTFKISDFGLTSFHSLESRQLFVPQGVSASYRAPEYDLDGRISQKYDMWSLGCVLTELLTWFLLGSAGVSAFGQKRMQEIKPKFKEDSFFILTENSISSPLGGAKAKACVQQHFDMLRDQPNCSDFISEVIDFVQDKLLRMAADKRCEVSEFLLFAKDVSQKCAEDKAYCTERLKPIRKRGTDLSEIYSRFLIEPIEANHRKRASTNRYPGPPVRTSWEARTVLAMSQAEEAIDTEIMVTAQEEIDPVVSDSLNKSKEAPELEHHDFDKGSGDEKHEAKTPDVHESNPNELLNVPGRDHSREVIPGSSDGASRYTIWDVLQDQVFDDHLPLAYDRAERPTLFLQDKSSGQWRQLRCFLEARIWGTQNKLDICQWQWYLTVPYMKVDITGSTFQAYQETFGKHVKLPWSSKSRDGEVMKNESTQGWGGYSAVYRYHIDDRFHGFHKVLAKIGLNGGKGFFALKVLNLFTESDKAAFQGLSNLFRNERQQLDRFNGSVHEHLVTLLAAFEQEDVAKNYFIFPWADCDLSGYWESQQARDVRWVAAQLNGLVGALDKIHNPPHLANIYGRHGDLKPDNILWYTPYKGDPRGILVISDMGFTAVNSEISRSKQTNGKARTPTYRAPELDIYEANVSREYDIWCLGCIFLEMMMWILGGDALIKQFKKERMTVENVVNGVKTPVFFAFDSQRQAVVKQEVIQIRDPEFAI
ncbi:hypothetical protein LQW54_007975 [Pestalotiopsis sp. IQ-011]